MNFLCIFDKSTYTRLIAIDDYVYDITKFGMFHPGGLAVLKMHAGTDCTKAFYGLHTKAALEKYHDKLVVGRYLGDGGTVPTGETTLKLPEKDAEDLISTVPYSEIPLLRSNWARMPWWTESHRDFLVAFRAACQPLVPECFESERDAEFISSELAQVDMCICVSSRVNYVIKAIRVLTVYKNQTHAP